MKNQRFAILTQGNSCVTEYHATSSAEALAAARRSPEGQAAGAYVSSGWRAVPFAEWEALRDAQVAAQYGSK